MATAAQVGKNSGNPRMHVIAQAVAMLCAFGAMAPAIAQSEAAPVAAPAVEAAPAPAQEAAPEVVITGSRIRGIAPVGSSVVTLGRSDIEQSGAVSTAKILQEVPQVFNLGVSENSRGQAGGAGNITFASAINLRGIGPFATLTLVDGHRVVAQGTTGATVDPSIIPALALQRVEIIADGASAIYGSDAVAGVANLILRRNQEALEATVRYGHADGYNERMAGALWGHKWKGGQVTAAIEHTYHSALNGQDRDFYTGDLRAFGGGDFRSTQCAPGNIVIAGTSYAIPQGGVTKATAGSLAPNTSNKCDNLKYADLFPRQERNSGVITFNQELTKGIKFFADGFATRRTYRLSPTILAANLTVPQANPFYVRPPGAPAGTNETVAYSFLNDLPPNIARGKSRTVELTTGLDIALPMDWKTTVLYTWGKNEDLAESLHGLNNAAISTALADTNPSTALNVFGGANNPATLAKISNNIGLSPGETIFKNAAVKADGPLFQLPAGKLRAAVGFEHQDVRTEGGQTTGPADNPSTGSVVITRTVKSAFAELAAPIIGSANALPGVEKLDLNAAIRYDKYSDVGSTNNPKYGVNWVPFQGLTVRGSYGTSFRAPGLTNIQGFTNGGRGGLFVQNYSDPTIGGALRVGLTLSAGRNPDLKPETATTRSLGVEWEPAFLERTKFGLTYFTINYDNQIVGYLSDLTILNREGQLAGTGIIQRNPSPAFIAQMLAQYPVNNVVPQNVTLFVDGSPKNLGQSISKGFDFSATHRMQTENWGDFTFGLNGTYFTKYAYAIAPGAPMVDQLNTIFNPLRLKARLNTTWNYGPYNASVFVNYINAYDNNLAAPTQKVASSTTFDLRFNYDMGSAFNGRWAKDLTLSAGVVNLFDKNPPFVNIAQSTNGGGGFDPTLTNPTGRIISVGLTKRF
ncbi:TonB-dependent receptor domain-containing protein [Pseudoduganella sp. UC29_106]|uniref:TonB-dependent receptor domain-containing protein n=1 Tax=Pseudoduganella sp. UC29_106 TaxID=3374553 RepID=UPI0037572C44